MNPFPQLRTLSLIVFVSLLISGCKSTEIGTTNTDKQFSRQPIVTANEKALHLDAMLIDAKTLQETGNTQKAAAIYREILAKDPLYPAANYGLSEIMLQSGSNDSAMILAKMAVTAVPNNVWYRIHLAQCSQNAGDFKEMTEQWKTIVEQNPNIPDYYYELSNSYLRADDVLKAINALNQAERHFGISEPVSLQKKTLWDAVGQQDKGTKELEKLAKMMPNNKKYNSILANAYMENQEYQKAKPFFERALAADPDDPYNLVAIATYYQRTGQPDSAYHSLMHGFRSNIMDAKTKIQVLTSFYTAKEFYNTYSQYSFSLLDSLVHQCSDSTTYALLYGDVLMRQGKYDLAAKQFLNHLSVDSSQYEVWEALLMCENETPEQHPRFAEHAVRANQLFPLMPLPYLFAAEEYSRRSNYERSFYYFDQYLKLRPDDFSVLNNYAYYLAELNQNLDKALQMASRTISAQPDNATFLDTYAWILHKLGRHQEALSAIQKAILNDKSHNKTLQLHLEAIEKQQ